MAQPSESRARSPSAGSSRGSAQSPQSRSQGTGALVITSSSSAIRRRSVSSGAATKASSTPLARAGNAVSAPQREIQLRSPAASERRWSQSSPSSPCVAAVAARRSAPVTSLWGKIENIFWSLSDKKKKKSLRDAVCSRLRCNFTARSLRSSSCGERGRTRSRGAQGSPSFARRTSVTWGAGPRSA